MDLWVKSAHIISVISWMAALLYLPRLFVYHSMAEVGSQQSDTFKVMERKLLKAIATPAMIASWVFGLWIASLYDVWADLWFVLKFGLVAVMTVMHFIYAKHVKRFASDQNVASSKHFRIINEIPAVLMIGIVLLVVLKPF